MSSGSQIPEFYEHEAQNIDGGLFKFSSLLDKKATLIVNVASF